MTTLTEEQKAKGRKRFLDANPQVQQRIDALTQEEADFMCTDLRTLRVQETMKALEAYARAHQRDSQELFLSCVADTAEEFEAFTAARNRRINEALGI